eukprot:7194419-Pyramimonas_sp.AAC.1
MPQGCPCAMLGMATVMAAPVWRAKRAAPDAILSVYADDRAAVGMTEHQIDRIEEAWAALEACTSMRTHRGKTQSFCMVQGAIWDMTRREEREEDEEAAKQGDEAEGEEERAAGRRGRGSRGRGRGRRGGGGGRKKEGRGGHPPPGRRIDQVRLLGVEILIGA